MRLAEEVGATFYISGNTFHFHERRLDLEPLRTITYWDSEEGDFAGEPTFEQTTLGRPSQVQRRGNDPVQRENVEGSASNETDTNRPVLGNNSSILQEIDVPIGSGTEVATTSLMQTQTQSVSSPTSSENETEAQNEATQSFRRSERNSVKATFPLIGMPWLHADMTIRVEGLPESLSGNYYTKTVTHTINSSGYKTKVEARRNALSSSSASSTSRAARQEGQTQEIEGRQNTASPPENTVEEIDVPVGDGTEVVTTYRVRGSNA